MTRESRRAASRVLLVSLVAVVALIGPLDAPASGKPSGRCNAGWLDGACEAVKGGASGVGHAVGGVVTAPVKAAAGGVMDGLTRWVADAAVSLLGKVVDLMQETTDPQLGADWFAGRYELMMGLGVLILAPLLLFATIRAIVRQDLAQLLRSFFVYLPIALLVTFVAVNLVQALLAVTDEMSTVVSNSVGNDASRFFEGGGSVGAALGNPAASGFLVFFGALLIIFAGLLLWIELLIRSVGIYVCVFFLPFVLACLVWPSTARWTRRLVETLVALILSKFVIAAVISLAVAAIGIPEEGSVSAVSTVVGGSALLLLAAFSPFALFKLIPIAEAGAIGHLEGMSRRPGSALRSGGWNLQNFVREKSTSVAPSGAGPGAVAAKAVGAGTKSVAAVGGAAAGVAAAAGRTVKNVATVPPGPSHESRGPVKPPPAQDRLTRIRHQGGSEPRAREESSSRRTGRRK